MFWEILGFLGTTVKKKIVKNNANYSRKFEVPVGIFFLILSKFQ